jgi:hypothetical protein
VLGRVVPLLTELIELGSRFAGREEGGHPQDMIPAKEGEKWHWRLTRHELCFIEQLMEKMKAGDASTNYHAWFLMNIALTLGKIKKFGKTSERYSILK